MSPNNHHSASKPLGGSDESGADFAREMLSGDSTYAINFDRLQFDVQDNQYVIFEYLLCEEAQSQRNITPFRSHPRRYWHLNSMKFISLWQAAQKLEAKLFLVNYAKKGTKYDDEILLIEVLDMDDTGITNERVREMTRKEYSDWFRQMNRRASG